MVLGVKDELQKLQRRMERIARVLKDAEKRRIQDEAVKGWFDELKNLIYDADDIIDLCIIQGAGLSVIIIILRLISQVLLLPQQNGQSSSLPEPDIVGWDIRDATKSLVELLVSHQQKCCLFAIVGMEGIGKTTLAQQVHNDSKINDDFVLHSWIWVSKSSTSKIDLLKEIIRIIGHDYGESTTITELQKVFCNVLQGKSLFLVLDDVWDADVWIDLIKDPIQITTKCSVLVTTRDKNTAMRMGAIHIHNVNK